MNAFSANIIIGLQLHVGETLMFDKVNRFSCPRENLI